MQQPRLSNEEIHSRDYLEHQSPNDLPAQSQPYPQSQAKLNRIESPSHLDFLPNKPPLAPYGIKFGEEGQVKKKEQMQYKEDLDYLCHLRKKYGEMTQKEWEDYNRKLNFMNDKYIYGEMDRRNFLQGMSRGYEDEMIYRREQDRLKRLNEYETDRKRFEGMKYKEQLKGSWNKKTSCTMSNSATWTISIVDGTLTISSKAKKARRTLSCLMRRIENSMSLITSTGIR